MEKQRFGFASAVFALALVGAIALAVVGIVVYMQTQVYVPLLAGVLAVIMTLIVYAASCRISAAMEHGFKSWQDFSVIVNERLEQFSVMVNLVSEQQLISERTKSVVFRDKDHEALNRAVREEMGRGQYDAALVLVNDMENTFGYKQEADDLRVEIAQMRDGVTRRAISDAIMQIDRDCSAENWDSALLLVEQTVSNYPGHELTADLPQQILHRKEAIKQQLLQRWRDAVARKDYDQSVEALQALDIYVTAEEVAQLREGALESFKARIEQLRQQFIACVHEKQWVEAQRVGQDILREFPTSKAAQEVRDRMDTLKERAEETIPAGSAPVAG